MKHAASGGLSATATPRVVSQNSRGVCPTPPTARRDGSDAVVWEVQAAAAELMPPDETHVAAWTRWVAVLRAGGMPPVYEGTPTNADREFD